MVKIDEYDTTLLTHAVLPVGPIPTVCDPEGVYPYESFAETSRRPEVKRYRMVALENERLRATICPDLGGRVHSMLDKASGQEALFVPASLCPVRILPRMGFIPGGIEVSFPIAHTPVQLERVHVQAERRGQRGLVWCGERELHSGLHWTVEYSLGAGEPYLTQRVYFQNRTPAPCPWTSWSNAAVPARPDTEFHFPGGPVLRHGATVDTIDWAREGPRCVGEVRRMTGYFWLAADAPVFGAFTPSLGQGLYHLADARTAPGIKLWTYGLGVHERWARAASLSGEGYVEIQGGPLRDQSQRARLDSGEARAHVEFWLPATAPLDLDSIRLPTPALPPLDTVPIFDWPPRPAVRYWQAVFEAYAAKAIGRLPGPPALGEHWWAPSGMDELGTALEWAVAVTDGRARDGWRFQHGAWLAGRGEVEGALAALEGSRDDRAAALAGRLHGRSRRDPRAAVAALRRIADEAVAWHPQIAIERDLALAALGEATLAERAVWLEGLAGIDDDGVIERRASLLADQGRFEEARALMVETRFQLVHQRYVRTALWRRIERGLGRPEASPPVTLGEDDLAAFGAYRLFEIEPGTG